MCSPDQNLNKLSCLNDDPDRLCVLGGYYDPSHRSPVTCDNLTENLYRTVNHNTLLMDDRKARELIRLDPIDGLLYLAFNVKRPPSGVPWLQSLLRGRLDFRLLTSFQ
jgi:hypothetical protein